MVRIQDSGGGFPAPRPKRRFYPNEPRLETFPIQHVQIDWQRLMAKRELVLDIMGAMPTYLLKLEVLCLLDAEKYPTYHLILDLMWTTGARIFEVLDLTPSHFIDDGYDFMAVLRTTDQRTTRPQRRAHRRPHASRSHTELPVRGTL